MSETPSTGHEPGEQISEQRRQELSQLLLTGNVSLEALYDIQEEIAHGNPGQYKADQAGSGQGTLRHLGKRYQDK